MKILVSLFTALVFFVGCGESPKPKNPKPEWISKHSVGAVGICKTHMKGNAVQEDVAMNRALQKLAKAKKSTIKTSSTDSQKEKNGRYSSGHESHTSVSSDTTVSAHEEGTWRDPRTNTYYIWMVPN
jgi:hypothetical protein